MAWRCTVVAAGANSLGLDAFGYDGAGQPHFLYHESAGSTVTLRHAWQAAGTWQFATVTSYTTYDAPTQTSRGHCAAIGGDTLHVVVHEHNVAGLANATANIYHTSSAMGGTWSGLTLVHTVTNNLILAANALKPPYNRRPGVPPAAIYESWVFGGLSLSVDSLGHEHIVVAYCNGGTMGYGWFDDIPPNDTGLIHWWPGYNDTYVYHISDGAASPLFHWHLDQGDANADFYGYWVQPYCALCDADDRPWSALLLSDNGHEGGWHRELVVNDCSGWSPVVLESRTGGYGNWLYPVSLFQDLAGAMGGLFVIGDDSESAPPLKLYLSGALGGLPFATDVVGAGVGDGLLNIAWANYDEGNLGDATQPGTGWVTQPVFEAGYADSPIVAANRSGKTTIGFTSGNTLYLAYRVSSFSMWGSF